MINKDLAKQYFAHEPVRFIPLHPNSKRPIGNDWQKRGKEDLDHNGNYGVLIEYPYLLIDLDKKGPERTEFERQLPSTWTQRTAREGGHGRHYLYKLPPGTYVKTTNIVWNGIHIGEAKTNGQFVGPGSSIDGREYHYIGNTVQTAPSWLISHLKGSSDPLVRVPGVESTGIPYGQHDTFLTAAAGFLRRYNLSEDVVFDQLRGLVSGKALEGYDETRPYTEAQLRKKAKHASEHFDEDAPINLVQEDWAEVEQDVTFDFPELDWYVEQYFPRGGTLVTVFGPGGVGKSSLGYFLAAKATRLGDNVLVINFEDTPQFWKSSAVLAGADRTKLFSVKNALGFKTPREVERLREVIISNNIKFVWVDAIKAHFDRTTMSDEATVTRNCLTPLQQLAAELNILIVGIFHSNKMGEYSGSTEMLNVGRITHEMSRSESEEKVFLKCRKNNISMPQYKLEVDAEEKEMRDPDDSSNVYMEIVEGVKRVRKTFIVTGLRRSTGKDIEKDSSATRTYKKTNKKLEDFRELIQSGATVKDIMSKLSFSRATYYEYKKRLESVNYIESEDILEE